MRVVVLGSHPANSPSMIRYTRMLTDSYRRLGHEVHVLQPPQTASRQLHPGKLKKLVAYIEQLVVFPLLFSSTVRKVDLTHIADHSDALWLLFMPGKLCTIVTCHDLIGVRAAAGDIPEHRPKILGRFYQWLVTQGLRKATSIVAVSDTTLKDVRQFFPSINARRIYNPIAKTVTVAGKHMFCVDSQTALIVGSVGWRKRRDLALSVWAHLRVCSEMTGLRLVVVGPPLSDSEIAVLTAKNIPLEAVEVKSELSDQELASVYAQASILIQMSKYEGFCWPILEANRQGVLAICADEPILRETAAGNVFVPSHLEGIDWQTVVEKVTDISAQKDALTRTDLFDEEVFDTELNKFLEVLRPS